MYDLVVIGGGAGGLSVALSAAKIGAKVAVVERGKLGGECVHSACIPSKSLLRAASIAHEFRVAGKFGILAEPPKVDFPAVMDRVRGVISSFEAGETPEILKAARIDVHFGSPAFEAYDTIVIDGRTRLSATRFVIATGSRPAVPRIPGLVESGYLDNQTIWDLNELPESLLIVGAGPVGLEFAQAFARLGSKVTVLDENTEILHHDDPEAARILREHLAAEGINFFLGVHITGVSKKEGKTLVKFQSRKEGNTFEALRSHILVSTGRTPNIEGLNLEAAGIHADPGHGIAVDDYLQTESRHIYAIGDVIGHDRYTHAAKREAAIVFQNAILKRSRKFRTDAVPRTVFTSPEFASVGSTEAKALQDDPEAKVYRLDFSALERARIDGETGGMAKVVVELVGQDPRRGHSRPRGKPRPPGIRPCDRP